MPLSTRIHESRLRVRYAETDAMGIAHHTSFVTWLEVGRVDWMRATTTTYAALERQGYNLPLVELRVRYVSAARFDDALVVRTALADIRSRSVRFTYEIVTEEAHPRQLVNATTRHICLLNGQVARIPDVLRASAEE